MKLILVRHGNTFEKGQTSTYVGARTDLPLTEEGKEQAESIADYLKENTIQPDVVFHSPLLRQKDTASIIAKRLGISNLSESEDLRELDYGDWENLTEEQIRLRWPQEFDSYTGKGVWPEAIFKISENEVVSKIQNWLKDLKKDYAGQLVLAVSSNGVLKILNKIFLGDGFDLKAAKVRTGAICIVQIDSNGKAGLERWDFRPSRPA